MADVRILLISGSTRGGSGNTAALRTVQALAPDGITAEMYDGLTALPAFSPDEDEQPPGPAGGRTARDHHRPRDPNGPRSRPDGARGARPRLRPRWQRAGCADPDRTRLPFWGDARIGNMIFAPGGTPLAALDWETATTTTTARPWST